MAEPLNLVNLATLLGGTKTTSNPGNTGGLEQVLAQLQGADYSKLLQGVFQQAAGAIPGLQVGLGNALGARSGNNSAVAAALQSLLQQTALAGTKQITDAQLQNQQLQVGAGQAIVQATKGTRQQSGTNLQRAAGVATGVAALQRAFKQMGLGQQSGPQTTEAAPFGPAAATPGTSVMPVTNYGPVETTQLPALSDLFQAPPDTGSAPAETFGVPDAGTVGVTDLGQQDPVGNLDWLNELFPMQGYADGGLIGRDGKKLNILPEMEDEKAEATAEAKSNARFDVGFTANALMDELQRLIGDAAGKAPGYADGGVVRAAGSRRSNNPLVDQDPVDTMSAATQAQAISSNPNQVTLQDLLLQIAGSPARSGSGGGIPQTGSLSPEVAGGAQALGAINTISGATGGSSIPNLGSMVGIATARSQADALSQLGQLAANQLGGPAAALYGLGTGALNDDAGKVTGLLAALANPAIGVASLASSLFGGPTAGGLIAGTPQRIDPTTGAVTEATQGLLGSMGLTGGGGSFSGSSSYATTSPVRGPGEVTVTSLPSLASAGTGTGDTGTSEGSTMANGGAIKGPGSGTSDNINIRASNGEYIIPADVVDAVGVDFFDMLRAALHTPAGAQ